MRINRYLKSDQISLDLDAVIPHEFDEDTHPNRVYEIRRDAVLKALTGLLAVSGGAGNESKLHQDLIFREKKATTAMGEGVAIPHVRTMQAKNLLMAFGRSDEGVAWDAPDGEPVHMFFAMVAPPYEDKQYLQLYKHLAEHILNPVCRQLLQSTTDPDEVIRILNTPAADLRWEASDSGQDVH